MQGHLQIALVGATFDDVRHVMVEGASGILNCAPSWCEPRWLPSQHKLIWPQSGQALVCVVLINGKQSRHLLRLRNQEGNNGENDLSPFYR